MNYFLEMVRTQSKFFYIVAASLIATVLLINNAFDFAERVINNRLLLLFSLLAFYFLVWMAIRKETKK